MCPGKNLGNEAWKAEVKGLFEAEVNCGNGHPFWRDGHRLLPGSRFCLRRCLEAVVTEWCQIKFVCAVFICFHCLAKFALSAQKIGGDFDMSGLSSGTVLAGSASVECSPFQKFGTAWLPSFACLLASRKWFKGVVRYHADRDLFVDVLAPEGARVTSERSWWFQSLFHSTVPGGTESTTSKEEHLGTNGMKENAYAACEIVKASLTYRCEVVMICNDMP